MKSTRLFRFIKKIKKFIIGSPLNPFSPRALRHASLAAFLAWIGLGADGLSSVCYGPEEAYLTLGAHPHLALYIAIATAITIFIISLGYNQVIELFPSGGGGYKVASQLLGPYAGLVSGAALIVDYMLTIAVSTASGVDALFSLFPPYFLHYKLMAEMLFIFMLLLLNARGMKESIIFLTPIFLGFFITHLILIIYGILSHFSSLSSVIPNAWIHTKNDISTIGWIPVLGLILHAYSLGSGTYTGLEAVSNNVNRLREPRIATGKWAMLYIAMSLSITAAGIILLYLLWSPKPIVGQTLNASVFQAILGHSKVSHLLLMIIMALEGGLLFIAANTGFLAGPSVLANMAIDNWMPNRFRQLSSRLIIQNGLILFGLSALAILILCHGKVSLLVVLYSINVFLTFSLSLLGLCRYWIKHKQTASKYWIGRLIFSALAFLITSSILCVTLFTKFESGGWITVFITCIVILICLFIRKHYHHVETKLAQLDKKIPHLTPLSGIKPIEIVASQPTAIILVGKSQGVALFSLRSIQDMFPDHFKNFIFISAGIVDVESFSGKNALINMQATISQHLEYFVHYCHQTRLGTESYTIYGTDTILELSKLANKISKKYPHCIFFATKLVFMNESWITRFLHNETALALQNHLHLSGKELIILPMKI